MNKKLNRTQYIANKIVELRKSVNLSQYDLACKARVASAALIHIERGDFIPSVMILIKLAEALNVAVSDLIGDSRSPINEGEKILFKTLCDFKRLTESDQKIIEGLISRLIPKKNQRCS